MYDRLRRILGISSVAISLLICIGKITLLQAKKETVFRTRYRKPWVLTMIPAEQRGTVRINKAKAEEMIVLPGIGEKTAQLIIAERESNGLFHYPEDLETVKGIGPKSIIKFREMIDLTTEGSDEQYGIPGALP